MTVLLKFARTQWLAAQARRAIVEATTRPCACAASLLQPLTHCRAAATGHCRVHKSAARSRNSHCGRHNEAPRSRDGHFGTQNGLQRLRGASLWKN